MAHPTLEYIRGLRKQLETKKAEITGENPPSSIPGSEHDSKVPASAKEPDKETKDQTMVPNSGLTTAGAGDDSKITHQNDLTADQSALTPEKKPEVTGDADAQVPGGKTAEEKTAEHLGAEILAGIVAWEQKRAEAAHAEKTAADTEGPSSGAGTAEALITDNGKEPEQLKDVKAPAKKDEVTADAMKPATGEGSSGETADAAKSAGAEDTKKVEDCKDGTCGKCAKCKAAAEASKQAGALDMELTSDVLAKIAAVMLATEEGTKLAEVTLAKAAGAEAAEKTLNFLRAQNELAQKQAEFEAGRRDALEAIKQAQEADGGEAPAEGTASDEVEEIANTLDAMVESGEITEDEADAVVAELVQAVSGDANEPAAEKKEAQDAGAAAAGDAAINQQVAVPPEQLDPGSVPQDGADDITPEAVAGAIDELVESGEITEDEADQLVQEITGGADDGEVSPEAIATALQEAVESGEIKPEDVQQVLTELEGVPAPEEAAPAGEAAPAAADAPAAEAGVPAAAAVAPADEPKTAGAKLMAAINAARAKGK